MSALHLTLAPQPAAHTAKSLAFALANGERHGTFAAPVKIFTTLYSSLPASLASLQLHSFVKHTLCSFLAVGLCSMEVLSPFQVALADENLYVFPEIRNPLRECVVSSSPVASSAYEDSLNVYPNVECPGASLALARSDEHCCSAMETSLHVTDHELNTIVLESPVFLADDNAAGARRDSAPSAALFLVASSEAEDAKPFLDYARVLSPSMATSLRRDIDYLEAEGGWRLRVITKSGAVAPLISGKDLKDLWKPDDKTVIVIEDLSSPNILNFNAGADVVAKLPRQFFLELQSRYGNQFFVQQEGEGEALMSTVQAIGECLRRSEGCKNVPGLTNDLYYLTLATSIAGGCVFGFAARLPPSGRVEASWQWVIFLSPLWLLLFVSFGVLPVVGRTSELEPVIKNALGFTAAAMALYLTPIFGPSPIGKR